MAALIALRKPFITLQILLCSLVGLLTVFTGKELLIRYTLPYYETGKYFDEQSVVIYQEQAILFYGIAFASWLFVLVMMCRWTLNTVRSQKSR